MRVYEHVIDELVKPAMREVVAVAGALGIRVVSRGEDEEGVIGQAIRCDPPEAFFRPSMCQDVEKVCQSVRLVTSLEGARGLTR